MPSLTFLGAAGTVTGSKHLVANGSERFLLDCGLFQGTPEIEMRNTVPLPFAPAKLGAVIVTHGHLDHVGYLPKLVRDGYRGRIYCTPATAGVMQIVLEDAAKLQERAHGAQCLPSKPPAACRSSTTSMTSQERWSRCRRSRSKPVGPPPGQSSGSTTPGTSSAQPTSKRSSAARV